MCLDLKDKRCSHLSNGHGERRSCDLGPGLHGLANWDMDSNAMEKVAVGKEKLRCLLAEGLLDAGRDVPWEQVRWWVGGQSSSLVPLLFLLRCPPFMRKGSSLENSLARHIKTIPTRHAAVVWDSDGR